MYGEVEGNLVIARPLNERYFQDYLLMFSSPIQDMVHVQDPQSELRYVHEQWMRMQKGETFFYCIFEKISDQLIGAIEIRGYDARRSQLYNWLNHAYWGRGYYQEALKLVAQKYFEISGNHFFNAHVDVSNKRSYRALKKCGAADTGFANGPHGKQYCLVIRRK